MSLIKIIIMIQVPQFGRFAGTIHVPEAKLGPVTSGLE